MTRWRNVAVVITVGLLSLSANLARRLDTAEREVVRLHEILCGPWATSVKLPALPAREVECLGPWPPPRNGQLEWTDCIIGRGRAHVPAGWQILRARDQDITTP